MKKMFMICMILIFVSSVFGALWYNDPASCPNEHGNYPGQSCGSTNEICGVTGGTIQCYDTDTLPNPPNDVNSNSSYSDSYNGGFLIDCFAYDGSSPFCDNSTAYWCDRDSTCYDKGRVTQCESGKWSGDAGDISCQYCRSPYIVCDGDHEDADGCEINPGVTNCPVGGHNNINGSCNCVCDSGYYDCNASGPGAGDGCEVLNGGSCTTGYGTSGTWNGPTCTCIGSKSYFETGTNTQYGTASDENFFWGTMWGTTGYLAFLQNATTDKNFRVDENANVFIDANYTGNCFLWSDGTSACTAPTGGSGVGDGNFYSIPDFNELFMKISDANGSFALILDVNGADNLRALITDVNGADLLRAKISDVNGTYYKEIDLNVLIQVPDFNNMIINLGEGQGWNIGGTDTNMWGEGQLNDYNAFNYDVNAQDVNGYFKAISVGGGVNPFINNAVRGVLIGGTGSTISLPTGTTQYAGLSSEAIVNTIPTLTDIYGYFSASTISGSDNIDSLVGALGYPIVNSGLYSGTLSNLIGLHSIPSISSATVTNAYGLLISNVTGATNNYSIKTGTGLSWFGDDMNIQGDLNVAQDLNVLGNVYVGGDLNISGNLHVDQNIIARSALGKAMLIPDENRLCVGTETVFCIGLSCNATGDCNANFGFI